MRKSKFPVVLSLFFLLGPVLWSAAENNGETAPREPEIVLPPVILQVENLTVERVKATLPDESEIVPPERDVPLPRVENLSIREPELKPITPTPVVEVFHGEQIKLNADGVLGIGNMNHILSSISLYKLGNMPRFKLSFSHEMLDGFAYHPAGSGFSRRNDSIGGFFKLKNFGLDLRGDGKFRDNEVGFQERSNYLSEIDRLLNLRLALDKSFSDSFDLSTTLFGRMGSLLLTGGTPAGVSEYVLGPEVDLGVTVGGVRLNLGGFYQFKGGIGNYPSYLHRIGANCTVGLELPLNMEGNLNFGWFYNSGGISLFTYGVGIDGSPLPFLNFYLNGGFKVRRYDLFDVIERAVLTEIPSPPVDDPVYFAKGNLKFSVLKNLVLSSSLSLGIHTNLPDLHLADFGESSISSLLYQRNATVVGLEAGFKWDATSYLTINGDYKRQLWDRPVYEPLDSVSLEVIGIGPKGKYGATLGLAYTTGFGDLIQLPKLDIGVFYRLSQYVRLVGSIDDLLTVGGAKRYNAFGLEEPGFKAVLEAQISF